MKIKTVQMVEESEFSRLVTETYGRPYQFQQTGPYGQPMGQDEIWWFSVPDDMDVSSEYRPTFEEWRDRDVDTPPQPGESQKYADSWEHSYGRELWWHREFVPPIGSLIDDLHERGLIPEGDYAMHVWW